MMTGIDVSLASENVLPMASYQQSTMELLHQQEFTNKKDSSHEKKTKKRKKVAEKRFMDNKDDGPIFNKKQKTNRVKKIKIHEEASESDLDDSTTVNLKVFFAVLHHAKLTSQTAFLSMDKEWIGIHTTTQNNRKYEVDIKTDIVTVTHESNSEILPETKHTLLSVYASVLKPKKELHFQLSQFTFDFDWERWILKALKLTECKWSSSINDVMIVHADSKSITVPRKKKTPDDSTTTNKSAGAKFSRHEVSASVFSQALQCMDKSKIWKWENKDWRILPNLQPSSKIIRAQRVLQQQATVILRHDSFQVAAAPTFYDNYVCTDECIDIVLAKHSSSEFQEQNLFLLRPATQLFKRYIKQ